MLPPCQLAAVGKCAPDIMLQGRSLGRGFGHVDALDVFIFNGLLRSVLVERLKEICRCEDGI